MVILLILRLLRRGVVSLLLVIIKAHPSDTHTTASKMHALCKLVSYTANRTPVPNEFCSTLFVINSLFASSNWLFLVTSLEQTYQTFVVTKARAFQLRGTKRRKFLRQRASSIAATTIAPKGGWGLFPRPSAPSSSGSASPTCCDAIHAMFSPLQHRPWTRMNNGPVHAAAAAAAVK